MPDPVLVPVAVRDTVAEHELTKVAARALGAPAEGLNRLAHERAGHHPVDDLLTRDFHRETAEELADARNYLVWWIEQLRANDDESDARHFLALALGHVAAAMHALDGADSNTD